MYNQFQTDLDLLTALDENYKDFTNIYKNKNMPPTPGELFTHGVLALLALLFCVILMVCVAMIIEKITTKCRARQQLRNAEEFAMSSVDRRNGMEWNPVSRLPNVIPDDSVGNNIAAQV